MRSVLSSAPLLLRSAGVGRSVVWMGRRSASAQSAERKSGGVISVKKEGGVAVLHLNDPNNAVNLGNKALLEELPGVWKELQNDSSVSSIVFYSDKPGNFIAGADIAMLASTKSAKEAQELSESGQRLLAQIENSSKPVVAAINGSCMGMGLELALACHYRIATDAPKTVLSLPEVMLGLLPGGGGTQRLPKTVGLPNSLDMMLTGKNVRALKAKKLGLVDQLVERVGPGVADGDQNTMRHLHRVAVDTAKGLASGSLKKGKRRKALMERVLATTEYGRNVIYSQAGKQVQRQTRGNYPAPKAILKCVQTGIEKGNEKGYKKEAEEFGRLAQTNESAALISLFFAQQSLKKNRFGKPKKKADTVAVLGAGLMGAGVAQVSLQKAGHNVILKDTNEAGLSRGLNQIEKNLNLAVKKRQLSSFDRDALYSKLLPTVSYDDGFEKADVVVEAVFEDIKVKHAVIREVEAVTGPDCVFASNTSALPIADIAKGSKRPQNVVGMHYFSPVDKMPLLEVITHPGTSKEASAQAVDVGLAQGKTVIVVKDGPGFYTTRILMPFISEAFTLMREGVGIRRLDNVIRDFGFPVGPVTLTDEVGIDVGYHIAEYLGGVWPERLGEDLGPLKAFVDQGYHGRKSGKGFYVYDGKKKGFLEKTLDRVQGKPSGKEINAGAEAIIKAHDLSGDTKVSDTDIQMRMVGRMVNEAVECLADGILENPTDGDIGAVFGLGFPPFLGGPFRWVDSFGAKQLTRHLEEYEKKFGSRFKPSKLLVEHAKAGSKFHEQKRQ